MTTIALFLFIFGIPYVIIALNTDHIRVHPGAFMIIGGILIGIGGNPAKDAPNGSPALVAVGVILTAIALIIMIVNLGSAIKKLESKKVLIALIICAVGALLLSLCISPSGSSSKSHTSSNNSDSDKGYWDSDGYYNPSDKEMDEVWEDVYDWMDDNW